MSGLRGALRLGDVSERPGSNDAWLRSLGRGAEQPEELERLVSEALRRGQLPPLGRATELPPELLEALGAARVRQGLCAWCGQTPHRERSGRLACCCRDCFVEVGVLCFRCPRRPREEAPEVE